MKKFKDLYSQLKERDYKKEYKNYHSKPEQIERRSARNSARRIIKKRMTDEDFEDKDVHHKDNNPLNNDPKNLSVVSKKYNRKEPRIREDHCCDDCAGIEEKMDPTEHVVEKGGKFFVMNVKGKSLKKFDNKKEADAYAIKFHDKLMGRIEEIIEDAEYQGRKVKLNNPTRSDNPKKKSMVYVKNDKGNIVKVHFGDPNMEIKRDDPARRKAFRSRHSCDDDPGPKWKARYWSCKFWEKGKTVTDLMKG